MHALETPVDTCGAYRRLKVVYVLSPIPPPYLPLLPFSPPPLFSAPVNPIFLIQLELELTAGSARLIAETANGNLCTAGRGSAPPAAALTS